MIDLDAVGQTALGVAYLRAYEASRPDALVTDPLALAMFASAVTEPDGSLRALPAITDDQSRARRAMYDWVVARTLFLDDLCGEAAASGVRQFVILGSGLDARAFRLDLGPDAVIYELDRSPVVDVKEQLVAEHQLRPTVSRRVVRADLTDEWLPTLRAAGLRVEVPTCWLAEGLLVYLDADVVHRVIDTIGAASAPDSRIGVTVRSGRSRATRDAFADVVALWHPDPGIEARFTDTGWSCEVTDAPTVLRAHPRQTAVELDTAAATAHAAAGLLSGRFDAVSVGRAD